MRLSTFSVRKCSLDGGAMFFGGIMGWEGPSNSISSELGRSLNSFSFCSTNFLILLASLEFEPCTYCFRVRPISVSLASMRETRLFFTSLESEDLEILASNLVDSLWAVSSRD